MVNQYSFFLGQNGGGGDAELKIVYGTATPAQSDRDKLWVACNEPTKVLMNNNLGIQHGNFNLFLSSSTREGGAIHYYNGFIYYVNNDYNVVKYNVSTGSSTFFIQTYNNKKIASIAPNSRYLHIVTHSGNTIRLDKYDLDSSSSQTSVDSYLITISSLTTIAFDFHYIQNNKWYLLASDGNSPELYVCDFNTTEQHLLLRATSISYSYSMCGDNSRYLYIVGLNSSNQNRIWQFDTNSNTLVDKIATGEYIYSPQMVYYNNSIFLFFTLSAGGNNIIRQYTPSTNVLSTFYTHPSNLYCYGIGLDNDGNAYASVSTTTSSSSNSQIYTIQLKLNLSNNYLAINYNTDNNRWKAINADNLEVSVNPVSAYLGNSSNQGVKQTAKLWNGSDWVNI